MNTRGDILIVGDGCFAGIDADEIQEIKKAVAVITFDSNQDLKDFMTSAHEYGLSMFGQGRVEPINN
jgi:hypothetical protein